MSTEDASAEPVPAPVDAMRASGMRDLGPEEMQRFRLVERRFLEVTAGRGYREIRTPTLEPLHLFTAAGALAPQMLDRVYSFLDWDGWSGERVVLRPDGTVPAARWVGERGDDGPARLCYVQPVFRFSTDGSDRELWQCGVELFGLAASEADVELLLLAREFLLALGLDDLRCEIAHAGLVRAALTAAGLEAGERLAIYDRLLAGDDGMIDELVQRAPQDATGLRLLFAGEGDGTRYLEHLRATVQPLVPGSEGPIADLERAARALEQSGCEHRARPVTLGGFEYYSGITFVFTTAGEPCVSGGRYDGLGEAIGVRDTPACGFGADLLRLSELAAGAGA